MQLREATPQDVPGIISVLRASLGESKLQKSEKIWNYKHIDNPFGESLVLLAIENNVIIGVRAFMRWKWQLGNQVFSAFRAVDTATHPAHQGKGVFKKLTLKAIEIAKEQGNHFIFNTPNSQSKPGYLKMGWQEVEKLKVLLIPVNPFTWKFGGNLQTSSILKNVDDQKLKELIYSYNDREKEKKKFFTPKSLDFLQWRYENNPLQEYQVKATANFYCASYVKYHKKFKELRIVENIYAEEEGRNKALKFIKDLCKYYGVQVISSQVHKDKPIIHLKGNFGPVLTVKDLNMGDDFKELQNLNNWSYSLGDLELF